MRPREPVAWPRKRSHEMTFPVGRDRVAVLAGRYRGPDKGYQYHALFTARVDDEASPILLPHGLMFVKING